MPWQEQSQMSLRQEFVVFAQRDDANIRALCRQYGISAKTGYKWLARAAAEGATRWEDHSRRPHQHPRRTPAAIEAQILDLRDAHPAWGGRKLHHRLRASGQPSVPAPSTITDILRRHGRLRDDPAIPHRWHRFTHAAPNDLWQLDFMGHRPIDQGRVHPLTVLDDHSRFALGLFACPHQRGALVRDHLTRCFQRYGLPRALLTDNGPPWGAMGGGGITAFEAWLIRLGIRVCHGQPYHPQTQGKIERLHGTIAAEVLRFQPYRDLPAVQQALTTFREVYNHERPHEALGYGVPASAYHASPRPFPATLPPIVYGPDDVVRKVRGQGAISFTNQGFFISRGLIGLPVAIRPTTTDGVFAVVFCAHHVTTIDVRRSPHV